MNELQQAHQDADDMYEKYLGARMRAQRLESGPGGIMEMKKTIADKEAIIYALESQIGLMKNYADAIDKENEQLQKYREFVMMIASEQFELSLEKAQLQQRDWRSKAVTLTSQLEFDLNFDTEDTSPLDDNF